MSRRFECETPSGARRRRADGIQRPLRLDTRGRQLLSPAGRSEARRFLGESTSPWSGEGRAAKPGAPPLSAYERSASYLLRLGIAAFIGTLLMMHHEAFQAALTTLARQMF